MKKVLFVSSVLGNINAFQTPYLKMFKEHNYLVYVAAKSTLSQEFKIPYCDKFIELPIERHPLKFSNIKSIFYLKKVIEKEKFNIIHCHTPMGSVVARLAARKARKKYGTRVIYTAHGFHFFKNAPLKNWLIYYPIEWFLAKYTDTIITINKEDYELAQSKFYKRCNNIEYVPGVGIDSKKFEIKLSSKEVLKLKESIGVDKNDYILTCVARLDKNKNQLFLINVMEKLKQHDTIHLLLVGPDELNGYYQNIVKEKKLNNTIHFLGKRDDIPQLLAISNIVVSASLREGLPVNVMEAFSAGIPVIALNCRGMSDLVENNKNGFIIDIEKNNDIMLDNYSSSILNVIKNNTKIDKKILIDDKFKIENVEKKMESIYFER